MAKTVAAMLIGIAIDEGRIRSVDDLAAAYVPALAGTEYGRTSLRHLLQMSSGVRFNEDYSRDFVSHDIVQFVLDTYMRVGPGGVGAVTSFNDRERPAGTKFSYSSVETLVLGLVLSHATSRPVAEYLQEKIWQPMGAEADATWIVDNSGQEATYCCLNAVLRDYARLGLLLAYDGNWRGRQIVGSGGYYYASRPTSCVARHGHAKRGLRLPDVDPSPPSAGCSCFGGAQGQRIYVDPRSKLVMVNTAVRKPGLDLSSLQEMGALWSALVRQLGG